MDKREKIKEWFDAPKPDYPSIGLVLCIVGIIIGVFIILISNAKVVGIIILPVAVGLFLLPYMAYKKAKKRYEARPSDSQMDSWLFEDFQEVIENNPLPKLGLDKSELVSESLLVPGPVFWVVPGFNSNEIIRRIGSDGFFRYSIWTLQIFVFTENFLGSYKCYYNWLRNTVINESTNEFFYKDVVSVKTDTESTAHTLMNGERLEKAQSFQLNLSGDSVKIIIDDTSLKTSSEMTSKVDKVVQSIRTMIRQKKS
jgi:hypothetical protein